MAGKKSKDRKKQRSRSAGPGGRRSAARNKPPSPATEGGGGPRAERPVEGGGLMTGMRSGIKKVAGSSAPAEGKKSGLDRLVDILIWIALAGALYLVAKRFGLLPE
jgi:hypothetical protein